MADPYALGVLILLVLAAAELLVMWAMARLPSPFTDPRPPECLPGLGRGEPPRRASRRGGSTPKQRRLEGA